MASRSAQKRPAYRDDASDDEDAMRRPSGFSGGNNWYKSVQSEMRRSGQVLEEPFASPPRRTGATPQSTPSRPTAQATVATTPAAAATTATSAAVKPQPLFAGVVAVVATPFDASGRVDVSAIGVYAASLKADGVTGVIVGAFAGEYLSLSERKQAIQVWTGQSQGLKVCLAIDDNAVADATDLVSSIQGIGGLTAVAVTAGPGSSPSGAAELLVALARSAPSTPLLLWVESDQGSPAASAVIEGLAGRCGTLRGVVAGSSRDLAAAPPSGVAAFDRIATAEEAFGLAAISGATAFASPLASLAGPLFARLTAASAKGDVAQTKTLSTLACQLITLCEGVDSYGCEAAARFRWFANAKAAASLRLDRDIGSLRPPAPRLSLLDTTQLRQGLELFIKAYTAAVASSAAAAPAKINVHAMPGFNGQLNGKIEASIQKLSGAIGMSGLRRKFPHLDNPSWRGRLPDAATLDCAKYIDHTILKPEATAAEVTTLCNEARKHKFYAVCVNGSRVDQCVSELRGSGVHVAAVIGFPLGAGTAKAHAREARELVEKGATEIDMVMNVGKFKDGDYLAVFEDIKAVVDASAPGIVKVIFETCLLNVDECIDACVLSVAAGAHFVKTSTGFNKGGATPDMIDAMLATVGNEAQVKASGGVRDAAAAVAYITAGVMRIGTSSGVAIVSGKQSGGGY